MSEHTRKVKNPLLTAAGQGFPFEGYSTSALLMPVTPAAAPAILPDETPEESSVGQEPANVTLPHSATSTDIGIPSVLDLGSVPQQTEPPSQPQRQGYFTSILSSLPNLSLSTITGDVPAVAPTPPLQQQAVPPNPGGLRESSPYGFAQNPYGPPPTSSGPFIATTQPRESSGQYPQGFGDVALGAPPTSAPAPLLPPTAAALPPSGGPGSYRLGNQRRLKYAPPPDLTSNTPKQFSTPPVSSFLPPVQQQSTASSASDFLIPSATSQPVSTSYAPPGSISSPNLYSTQIGSVQSSQSLSSSFSVPSVPDIQQRGPSLAATNAQSSLQGRQLTSQYNPAISAWSGPSLNPASAPQEIPSRFPETATPQNTPANATFASFASSYAPAQQATLISSGRVDSKVSAGFASSPGVTKFSEGLTFDVPSSAFARSNVGPISGAIIEPNISSSTEDTPAASATIDDKSFTPISAAKVTAKLEHLLAEREEDSSPVKAAIESSLVSTDKAKSPQHLQQQQPIISSSEPNQQESKSEASEDLAEIDLTANDSFPGPPPTQDILAASQISTGIEFAPALGSESFARSGSHLSTPAETNVSSKSSSIADIFAQNQPTDSVASATSFFSGASQGRKSELNYLATSSGAPPAFYNPQQSIQSHQNPSSFFNSGPPTATSYAQSPFLTSVTNPQQIPSVTPAQSVPTFYNPGGFPPTSREPSYSVFTPQISGSGPSVPNPFATVLGSSPPNFPTSDAFMATAMPEPTGSATLNPVQMSVNPGLGRSNPEMVPPSLQNLAAGPADRRMQYRPVYHHWFYRKEVESKILWLPFSMQDSLSLEEVHNSSEITPETTVATDGGRYDVDILRRRRSPVYWTGNPTEVRRSSWFFKGSTESRYIPYEESTSARLEEEYKQACTTDNWNRRIELNNGEYIIFHSSTIQVHYVPATSPELAASWGNSAVSPTLGQTTSASSRLPIRPNVKLTNPLRTAYALLTRGSETGTYLQGAASRPKVVKRGVDEFNIDEGEPEKVDHLLFLVHGIGSVCDLKFRTVEEVVDEFRSISLQLVQSHYRTASMHGVVNRIEVLPISWHTTLHSEDTGIDKKLQAITLESIPKLRHFTNDTLLDILFYTSPIYCQTIMQTVGNEMNRLYSLFKDRNPNFGGAVYLGGHSLGSLIVFDLLCHQKPPAEESRDETDPTLLNPDSKSDEDTVSSIKTMVPPVLKRRLSKKVSYVMGAAGTGQPFINYPQLSFLPQAFFALGSPIGMFVTVRGIDTLGDDFALPTCPAFFNVFHPFDPVAYRVESLINPDAHKYRPMLIPHHKGRKRMHLELKETMARVGADLKQKLLDSVRSTWNSVYQLAMFHRPDNQSLEQEIEKVVEEQLQKSPSVDEQQNDDDGGADFRVGKLNGGRRIDYVLQEAPFEYINEYIFALTSHVCYWESEDTMLMMLKEIYGTNGVQADAQLPPQTMTIERVSPSPSIPSMSGVSTSRPSGATTPVGTDPTMPIASNKPVGPPPISGFVRKS